MLLNDLERFNRPNFAFFTEFDSFAGILVDDRRIMSVKYYLPVPIFHFWPKVAHLAALSLCDS